MQSSRLIKKKASCQVVNRTYSDSNLLSGLFYKVRLGWTMYCQLFHGKSDVLAQLYSGLKGNVANFQ